MAKHAFLLIIIAVLAACAAPGVKPRPEEGPLDRLEFIDSRIFDKNLSSAMRAGEPEIEVTSLARFSPNAIPERLDKWFYAIDEKGGRVEARALSSRTGNQGLIGDIVISIIIKAYEGIRDGILYGPAGNYNAAVYHRDGAVEKIVFFLKGTGGHAEREKREERPPPARKPGRGRDPGRERGTAGRPEKAPGKVPDAKPPGAGGGFLEDIER